MSAPAPSAVRKRLPLLPRAPWQAAIDCAVILVVLTMATLAFGPVFGGVDYLIAGVGGALAGILVGVVTSLRPLRGWLVTVAGIVVAYVVFGPALAVRHATIGGVIPTLDGLRELMLGSFISWRSLLTAQPPVQGFPSLLVVPMLTTLLCAALATVLAIRLRRGAAWAMLPGVVALVVGIAFGTRIAAQPILLGVVTACASIAWIAWRGATARRNLAEEVEVETQRDDANRKAFARRRLIGGVGMVAAAAVVASVAAVPISFTNRQVLRDDVEPPVELADYPSPLAGFRQWHKNYEEATLLTVSGMPEGARLRLATLDWYDGSVYAVAGSQESSASGSFTRVGDAIGTSQPGDPARIQVEIGEYTGIWVPSVGYAEAIDFGGSDAVALQSSLAYNGLTGNVIAESGLGPGDTYTIDAIVPPVPEYEDLEGIPASDIDMPEPAEPVELITAWASSNATERTTLDNILAMTAELQTGAFSHGVGDDEADSLAGHTVRRLTDMFNAETLLGDDEQYAAAFALALEFYGVPARVVMGLYPGEEGFEEGGEAVELTGGDMHAWVEVSFQGVGWVPFDPTPPEDNTQVEPEPQPEPDPRPQVLQPPQPPEEPAELLPNTQPDQAQDDEDERESSVWLVVLAVAGIVVGSILLLLLPFLVIGLLKARRRRRRFEAASESERLAGGWHEVVDEAVDLGLPVPAGVTRREVASTVEDRYPQSRATAIGEYVDAGVFGPGEPHRGEIDAFWKDVDRSVKAMRQEASRVVDTL